MNPMVRYLRRLAAAPPRTVGAIFVLSFGVACGAGVAFLVALVVAGVG